MVFFPTCSFLSWASFHFRFKRIRICICGNWISSLSCFFFLQSSWNKSANQPWTNSIARYGDTITKEPLPAVNGSLKLPSSAGQKLLFQALVYDAVMVGVFGLLPCAFWCVFSIYVPHPFCSIGKNSWPWALFFPRYRTVCLCHWWDLSKICAYFFPRISESLSSPLFALTSGSPEGLKRTGRKKAEKGFVLLVMSTGLGQLSWQEGCSSPGSFGPLLWPWVRSCSAQHRVTNSMMCLLGEGIAFWSTVGVKGWGGWFKLLKLQIE